MDFSAMTKNPFWNPWNPWNPPGEFTAVISGGDVESWEDLEEDVPQDMEDVPEVPSDVLCISGVPPGIQEMVMQCLGCLGPGFFDFSIFQGIDTVISWVYFMVLFFNVCVWL